MKSKKKTLLLAAGFIAFIAVSYAAYNYLKDNSDAGDNGTSGSSEQTQAADFTVFAADGTQVKLSDMKGKPVVLNFWASWCPPCREEMPAFETVFKKEGVEISFIMVNLTDGADETKESAEKYIKENKFTFPIYFDLQAEASDAYSIRYVPTTYFIDREGRIVSTIIGGMNEETLKKNIELIR